MLERIRLLCFYEAVFRKFPGEIYVCRESDLSVLDAHNIHYEEVPLPVIPDEVDAYAKHLQEGLELISESGRRPFVQGGQPESNRRRH